MLESREFLDLETLCRELDASESSIRRDLGILEQQKIVKRVYGGAVLAQPGNSYGFDIASTHLGDEKSRIAKVAAGLVQERETIVLDGGSTVASVARELAARSLHIVTNSLPIAETLQDARNIELILTGGYLYPRLRVMLGPYSEQMLSTVRADRLIMGIGSISDSGFSNNNTLVVGSERKMLEIARQVIIVADHTKFARGAMIPLAPLEAAHIVVSDNLLEPQYQDMLQKHGVQLLLA